MNFLQRSQEVEQAQLNNRPVVALESTIITHGMPWPQNFETAQLVEAEIRACGAIPATIAVLDGTLHVGLSNSQLTSLAQSKNVAKLRHPAWRAKVRGQPRLPPP